MRLYSGRWTGIYSNWYQQYLAILHGTRHIIFLGVVQVVILGYPLNQGLKHIALLLVLGREYIYLGYKADQLFVLIQ